MGFRFTVLLVAMVGLLSAAPVLGDTITPLQADPFVFTGSVGDMFVLSAQLMVMPGGNLIQMTGFSTDETTTNLGSGLFRIDGTYEFTGPGPVMWEARVLHPNPDPQFPPIEVVTTYTGSIVLPVPEPTTLTLLLGGLGVLGVGLSRRKQ